MTSLVEYRWIAIAGGIFGCIYAFGIGANDVANSFGSSVSAKSLTLVQAIIAASIFELSGAMLLGASVTSTIRGKIIKSSYYQDIPQVLMFGMLCSLLIGAIWLLAATAYQYPVSTTHTIIACICGFSLTAAGWESIDWIQVTLVIVSWVTSPLLTGLVAFIMFILVKKFVLNSERTFERAVVTYPVVIFIGITVNVWFVLYKSNNKLGSGEDFVKHVVTPVAFGSGLLCSLVTFFILGPFLKRRIERYHANQQQGQSDDARLSTIEENALEQGICIRAEGRLDSQSHDPVTPVTITSDDDQDSEEKFIQKLWNFFADNTFRQDLQSQSLSENKRAAAVWENSILYEPKTEHLFSYTQGTSSNFFLTVKLKKYPHNASSFYCLPDILCTRGQ
jgi:sodium-dependent phosphate transporter